MGRPCKSAKVLTECSQTKDEIQDRVDFEEMLKGNDENLIAPTYLSENQKFLFEYIKSELEESKLLGNLDIYILSKCCIAIDRLQTIENKINQNATLMFNKKIMSTKDKYDKDFYRCCNELSLSPQARAKLSNINMQTKSDANDPILQILQGED